MNCRFLKIVYRKLHLRILPPSAFPPALVLVLPEASDLPETLPAEPALETLSLRWTRSEATNGGVLITWVEDTMLSLRSSRPRLLPLVLL